jgi:hypothetical protein
MESISPGWFMWLVKDATAISLSAYLLTAFWAFMSLDVRDFLRRR